MATDVSDVLRVRLRQFVTHETPSGDSRALESFAGLIGDRWRELGMTVRATATPAGPVVVADLPGRGWGALCRPVLLVGHADTVWPTGTLSDRMPWTENEGVVRGPGVFDMKAGLVVIEAVVARLGSEGNGHPPLRVFVAPDEETGSAHSRDLLSFAAEGCVAALGFESPHPDGGLKVGRFGSARVRLTATGREAHAALDTAQGVSAIDELVDHLMRLRTLVDSVAAGEDALLNVGSIVAAGRTNVVAASAVAEVGLRFARQDLEDAVLGELLAFAPVRAGAQLEVLVLSHRPPWDPSAADRGLARRVLPTVGSSASRGAADTNLLAKLGLPVIDGCGPRGAGAHSLDERAELASMIARVDALSVAFSDETLWRVQPESDWHTDG